MPPTIVTAQKMSRRVLRPRTAARQNEIQTLTYVDGSSNPVTPESGSYDLVFDGQTTADIGYGAIHSDIGSALNNLSNISGQVDVDDASPGSGFTIEFIEGMGGQPQDLIGVVNNSLVASDNTISVTTTTPYTVGQNNIWSLSLDDTGDGTITFYINADGTDVGYFGNSPLPADAVQSEIQSQAGISLVSVVDSTGDPSGSSLPLAITFTDGVEHTLFIDNDMGASASVTETQPGTGLSSNQIDSIVLDANVSGGSFHIGSTTDIAFNDSGSTVQAGIEALLSISGGTLGGSPGNWTYEYASPEDQTSNTATIATNTVGDSLTQVVSVVITVTLAGG